MLFRLSLSLCLFPNATGLKQGTAQLLRKGPTGLLGQNPAETRGTHEQPLRQSSLQSSLQQRVQMRQQRPPRSRHIIARGSSPTSSSKTTAAMLLPKH